MKKSIFWILGLLMMCITVMIQAEGPDPEDAAVGYIDHNVVIVLDASGSMNTKMQNADMTRMQAAKNALVEVLRRIPDNTHVGILVFSARNVQADWLYPLGPVNESRLINAVDTPYPGGSTPLGKYLKKGADALLARRAAQFGYGTYRLIVVTDGEAGDPKLVERFVPDIMSRGIMVDAIGLDMEKKHTLATRVHSYRGADDPASLTLALESVFAEVGGNAAADAGDGGDAGTPEDAFDQLAAVPDEIALAMLGALASSGNHPIGEVPGSAQADAVEDRVGEAQVQGNAGTPTAGTGSTTGKAQSGVLKTLVVVIVVLIIVARKGLKRK